MPVAEAETNTVLVVEDDPTTRATLVELLKGEGYATLEARNGEQGLALAREHRPSAVLLDLALPETSGLTVLDQLKTDLSTSSIPVIVVSAYADLMGDEHAQLADGVIAKPFDIDAILAQVERATDLVAA